jgi:hypothetical protein
MSTTEQASGPQSAATVDWRLLAGKWWVWLAAVGALLYPAMLILGLLLGAGSGKRQAQAARVEIQKAEALVASLNAQIAGLQDENMGLDLKNKQAQVDLRLRSETVSSLQQDVRRLEALIPQRAEFKPGTPQVENWTVIAHWVGTGYNTTESFSLPTGRARVRWVVAKETEDDEPDFSLYVYSDDGSESYVEHAERDGECDETTYVRSKPGMHYVKVISVFAKWDITVEVPQN